MGLTDVQACPLKEILYDNVGQWLYPLGHCGECPDMNYMRCPCLFESEKDLGTQRRICKEGDYLE